MKEKSSISLYSWIVWAIGASFFFIQYFPRIIPSIATVKLMQDFHVDALSLGGLSAFYLIAYISMQVPAGVLLDRFGVRRLLIIAVLAEAVGCLIFATTDTLHMAEIARFLGGFGGAFGFVGAMKLASLWFPVRYFGVLAGATQALGMLGAAIGQGPMAYVLSVYSWRTGLLFFAFAFFLLALVIFIVVRDRKSPVHKPGEHVASADKLGFLESLLFVLKNPQSWINAGYLGLVYAPTMVFAELWGVSYLQGAYNISHEMAALVVSAIFWGWAVGGPIAGWLSDHIGRRKPVMLVSALASLVLITLIIYGTFMPLWLLFVCCFFYGVGNTGIGASYALSGEINPRRVAGTSIAFANMSSIIIGAFMQPIVGWLLVLFWDHKIVNDVPWYSVSEYQQAFISLPLCLVVGFIFAMLVKDSYCKPVES